MKKPGRKARDGREALGLLFPLFFDSFLNRARETREIDGRDVLLLHRDLEPIVLAITWDDVDVEMGDALPGFGPDIA